MWVLSLSVQRGPIYYPSYCEGNNIWHLLWMQISVEILSLLDVADDIWAVVLGVQCALNYDIVTSVTAEITRGDLCG